MDATIEFDAGDAARPDAPYDAGADAAPLPPLVVTAASNLQMEEVMFQSTRVAVTPTSLMMIDVLELDLCVTGIDALIGENGIQTLSLSEATARALADVDMSGRLLAHLDASIALLPVGSAPDITALRDEALRLRDSLAAYRATLVTLFRARLADGIIGTPIPTLYSETLFTQWTNERMQLEAVVERDSSSTLATVGATCAGVIPTTQYHVFDEESGLLLASGGTGIGPITVDVSPNSTRVLRIELDPITRTPPNSAECIFTITSQRNLRTAPQHYSSPTFQNLAGVALASFVGAQNTADSARAVGAPPYVVGSVERVLTLLYSVISPIRVMEVSAVAYPAVREDLERALRLYTYVDATLTALIGSPELAQAVFGNLRNALTNLQLNIRAMIAEFGTLI